MYFAERFKAPYRLYINKADSKMYVEKESHKRTRMLHDYSKDKPQTDE